MDYLGRGESCFTSSFISKVHARDDVTVALHRYRNLTSSNAETSIKRLRVKASEMIGQRRRRCGKGRSDYRGFPCVRCHLITRPTWRSGKKRVVLPANPVCREKASKRATARPAITGVIGCPVTTQRALLPRQSLVCAVGRHLSPHHNRRRFGCCQREVVDREVVGGWLIVIRFSSARD